MAPVCAVCSQDTVQGAAKKGADVCTVCKALAINEELDAPYDAAATAAPPFPTDAERRLRHHVYDAASAKLAGVRRQQVRVVSMMHSAALRLGYAYAAEQASALFRHAQESLPAPMPWAAVGAAALYVVLRKDARIVDVDAVAIASEVPVSRLVHTLQMLRTIPVASFAGIVINDPALYLGTQLASLQDALGKSPRAIPEAHAICALDPQRVEHIALDLARMCTAYQLAYLDPQPFAYAILLHALEGTVKVSLPVRALAELGPSCIERRISGQCLAAPPSGSVSTILARYAETQKMLAEHVASLPWVANRAVQKRERDRTRGKASVRRSVSRQEVAYYLQDALAVWSRAPTVAGEQCWTRRFKSQKMRIRTSAKPAPYPSYAERMQLTAADIDTLSDTEIDARLFAPQELEMYMRSDTERAMISTLKGWDESARPSARKPPPSPPHKIRIRDVPRELFTPLDLAAQTEENEWD
ncbi:hypothetical protein MVES1_003849 [Malassezia vespertilionis]|uniref:Uncharacterized protein n=1 Tax=Malassezia vespertilionis TaxID=2020962 RepID=A0A2N1J7S9_9BASI|nr:uncharacterized protein MVES1_003849 [Malassezia vespertilionis]PKI82611.1 hypothetical protein MVES_003406 [Malassezia vespertilionis]WFD08473.1 hypothetical protein MVES1_003849 [Malassezia vespertilionis]